MTRSLPEIAFANEVALNRIRDILDPHRRLGESDEDVLERLVKNRMPTGDVWQRAGINTISLVYQGDEIDTILAVRHGKEIRFARESRPVSEAEHKRGGDSIAPPRIGDILVDAAGNRALVTHEGRPVNDWATHNPDGTVTLAPGVWVERKA